MHIAVFSTFDISRAQNGGEARMLSLYSRLAATDDVRVVSYDLRCRKRTRRERLASGLEIIDTQVPESDRWAFFQANERLGLYPHDVLFVDDYGFSPDFLHAIREALTWADVVVVSHPYLATQIFPRCSPGQLRVLEAHNVELAIKTRFFATARDRALADRFLDATQRCEAYALDAADVVLTVDEGDREALARIYGTNPAKMHVVPNGVSVAEFDRIPGEAMRAFRAEAGLTNEDVGVFLGSAYGPNVDSYRITRAWLDEAGFTGTMLVVGSIADAVDDDWPLVRFTERWLGFVEAPVKALMLKSADFLTHVILSGGGTNLKLFDYMAAQVPILASAIGRRGVEDGGWFIPADDAAMMSAIVQDKRWRGDAARAAAKTAHDIVLRDFDWDGIAERYRMALT